jgi:hypothetical protein
MFKKVHGVGFRVQGSGRKGGHFPSLKKRGQGRFAGLGSDDNETISKKLIL